MKLYLLAISWGLIFGYILLPLFCVGVFCNNFSWENIKKIYSIIFSED